MANEIDATSASALHVKNGNDHLVGVAVLRVLLTKDGDSWFAQGLEIDYAAAGADLDEVKKNFSEGLIQTVHEHLRMLGNIKSLLKVSPQEAWDEFYAIAPGQKDSFQSRYSTIQFHHCTSEKGGDEELPEFPFTTINFIERDLIAA